MKDQLRGWKHVFKLDPDRPISDEDLNRICLSGTDAVMIGGSTGVTIDNTVDLLARIRKYAVPCVLEISDREAIVPGFDLYFIPVVLNTGDADWIVGHHHQAIKEYGSFLQWDEVVAEGYVILNESSAAAAVTRANAGLDLKDVVAYARLADRLFQLPLFYIEYSGKFGDMELVKAAASTLQNARLFYGGGIDGYDKAIQASQAAHTIVVGNIIYDNLQQALETVKVKGI